MRNITVRREEPRDYRVVEEITRDAFWNLHSPGCDEHLIVHCLRKHSDFIPELTFVIELEGNIAGGIFYSHSKVVDKNKAEHKTLTFGPVSIAPHLHRQGLGRILISHSIAEAKKLGHRAIIIGGYPYHYQTYGFTGAKKYGISATDGNYYVGILALPLFEGALDNVSGCIHFTEAMETDERELEQFDKGFPQKEKLVKDSQAEFEKVSAKIDTKDYGEI